MASSGALRKPNGILPAPTLEVASDTPKASRAKDPLRGKKTIVRRLPPGMTEAEFWALLGDEWKVGKGKVGWTKFHDGHISQDPSNPSAPARCYLHVLQNEDIAILAEMVQKITWEDEKRSFNDPALVGPPYLDVSVYQKVPTTKRRIDSKQGTIDQDPDFMAFLDSLTQDPAIKEVDADLIAEDSSKSDIKVTTTPLIEYLKEKRANKGKDTTTTKGTKHSRHESQGGKMKEDSKKKAKEPRPEKPDKAAEKEKDKTKEPVKLLTKKVVTQETAETAKPAGNKAVEETVPKSRRANIAAAAKLLQRDLGLSPGSAHRRARQDAATKVDGGKEKDGKDSAPPTTAAPSQSTSSAPPSAPTAPKAQADIPRRSRGAKAAKNASSETPKGKGSDSVGNTTKPPPMITTPVILKRKDDSTPAGLASTTSAPASTSTPTPPTGPKATASKASSNKAGSSQKKGSSQPSVTAGATRAFLKHANPSQGVTEPLLKQAMETFGSVTFVEIDKRKGFAYVEFSEHDGLVKAVTASPISVAQGTVQVLERKEIKKPAPAPAQLASDKTNTETPLDRPKRGGRGRGRRGGGGASGGTANATKEASTPTETHAS
ncbi:Smg-4/UPF3 family-domain-containing protein [Hypoxylon sp. FL1150]|nr:Smg-4/UPF3 family-domain-containing protein [Hypoxylon sp. FL1150]